MIKTVISTVLFTVTVLSIVFSVFLNSILGLFGLMSTSIDAFNKSQAIIQTMKKRNKKSQQIIQTMKDRNIEKKSKASKKFVKKAGTRVAASAVAAATIGTAAVTITVFGLEVHDYCEEKKELFEDENTLFGTAETFDYKKCVTEAQNDSKQILVDAKDSISGSVLKSWESTTKFTTEQWKTFKRESDFFWEGLMWSTSDWFG